MYLYASSRVVVPEHFMSNTVDVFPAGTQTCENSRSTSAHSAVTVVVCPPWRGHLRLCTVLYSHKHKVNEGRQIMSRYIHNVGYNLDHV